MRIAIALFLLCSATAFAQNGGTIESRFGIGELNSLTTSRQRGMGGVSTPLLSEYDINQSNPAAWTSVNQLRLSTGVTFEHLTMSKTSNTVASGAIKGFQFLFPLEESMRTRFSAGLLPISRSEYSAIGTQSIEGDEYDITYEGNGGISMLRAGFAFTPIDKLSFGAAYLYYFGTIEQSWELRFDDPKYFPAVQRRATSHNGSGVLIGVVYDGPGGLTFGASVSPEVSLSAGRNLVLSYSTMDSTISGAAGTQTIPMEYALGLSWRMNDEMLFAMDYRAQNWSEAIVFSEKQSALGAAYTMNVGFEWQPFIKQIDARTLSRTVFRFGLSLAQPYISLQDNDVQEIFLTTGAGFPIFGSSRADVAAGYGWRGSESNLLGTQNIFRLSLSVSVGESWFIRNKE